MSLRALVIDLETSPNVAHVWSLWKQNVSLAQLQESGQVISFAARWHGESKVMFHSDFHDGHEEMVKRAHALIDEADAVVGWNSQDFDGRWLRSEFLHAGLTPPSPYKDIDLMKAVKKQFKAPSYKLDYWARRLGVGGKVSHTGHQLWVDCLAGDPKAWALMKRYNVGDTRITDDVYTALKAWLPNHPHLALYDTGEGVDSCGRCGSEELERRGYAFTNLGKFPRFACKGCGSWSRGKRAVATVDVRGIS